MAGDRDPPHGIWVTGDRNRTEGGAPFESEPVTDDTAALNRSLDPTFKSRTPLKAFGQ